MSTGEFRDAKTSVPPPPETDGIVGLVVGERYRVVRKIGEGGAGAVYLAQHVELDTSVALKVLSMEQETAPEDVERFMREARAAVSIGHPNIVRVLDLGRMDDGTPYMVMEHLVGRDLEHLRQQVGWLPIEEVAAILRPIASAVDAVHEKGLVHRDIKPGNIFLAEARDEVTPKLLDFGLAQLRDRSEERRLTRKGLVVGTPHYLAPEVGMGNDPDEASDLYSFAVVAYELLAGRLPFDDENGTAILVRKVHQPPPPMRQTPAGRPPLAAEAEMAAALSRNPSQRPTGCLNFLKRLENAFGVDADRVGKSRLDTLWVQSVEGDRPRALPLSPLAAPSANATPDAPSTDRALAAVGLSGRSRWLPVLFLAGLGASIALVALSRWTDHDPPERGASSTNARVPDPPDVRPSVEGAAPDTTSAQVPTPGVETPPEPEPRPEAPDRPPEIPSAAGSRMRGERGGAAPMRREVVGAMEPAAAAASDSNTGRAAELTSSAQSLLLRGRLPRAASLFREATRVDPGHAAAWRGLGITEERLGHVPEARRAYRRYLRIAGGAGDAPAIRRRLEAL